MKRSKKRIMSLVIAICMLVSMFSGLTLIASTPTEAIALIVGYASDDNAGGLTIPMLTDAGVIRTDGNNILAYKTAIAGANALQVDTLVEIQKIIDDVNATEALNAAITTIKGYINSAASSLTIVTLVAAGVIGTVEANIGAYQTAIGAKTLATDLDSTAKIQAIINGVNAPAKIQAIINGVNAPAVNVIIVYAYSDNATAMTIAQLVAAGVTGTVVTNLEAYKTAVAAASSSDVDATSKIQTLIDGVNLVAAINTIKGFSTNAAAMTIPQLIAAKVTDTNGTNLVAYQTAIAAKTATELDSTSKIQAIITTVNAQVIATAIAAAIEVIKTHASNDELTTSILELTNAGVTVLTIISDNLAQYQTAISLAIPSQVDTTAKIQTIIDTVNTTVAATAQGLAAALNTIKVYAANDDAGALSIAQLVSAGVLGTVESNLGLYTKLQ